MIYCIGNSHANFFTGAHPATNTKVTNGLFTSYNIGPTIAYNFYEHHFPKVREFLAQESIDKSENSVMLVVGEVDCRWHIPRQADLQGRDVLEVTRECVKRFFQCLLHLMLDGYNVIGWGGHPSTTDGHSDNPNSPVFGDYLTRNRVSMEWSRYLGSLCDAADIKFVSIVEDLINEDGLTRMDYFSDYCHLNANAFPIMLHKLNDIHG